MFDQLTRRLTDTMSHLFGQGRLTEKNIEDALRQVQVALLEADVALSVVKPFIANIKQKAVGQEVLTNLRPGETLIKLVHDELIVLLGESSSGINLNNRPPVVILLAGLQGSGKTTSAGKLARWLKEEQKKSVLVTSCDIYRPAAIQQLETLAKEAGVDFYPSHDQEDPVAIAQGALDYAKRHFNDVLIVDTAGRLHIDAEMMAEVSKLHAALQPVETLFVVDSMTGQDAANTARVFNDTLALTGVILTKTDGDARGGAALSIRQITGKPIKFIGTGEKQGALEPFHPDRIASRILGMGDVLSLIEDAQKSVDHAEAEKLAKKLQKGKGFDLEDFLMQLKQLKKMGGIANLLGKIPGMGMLPAGAKDQINDKLFIRIEAMISSMTRQERRYPHLIRGSRKRRIAAGAGVQVPDVNRLLKQFEQMQKMMKRFAKPGMMAKLMKGIPGL